MDTTTIYEQVRQHYTDASKISSVKYGEAVAKSFGYTAEELAAIPKDANLGLSCGNPLAVANLKEGETVIDLGSGAGFDVFLAAKKVGVTGRAIGVDMNDDMLARANQIKASQPPSVPTSHIDFIKANITSIPLPDSSADCIISNCVINLVPAPDKPAVFREMARLLKPGGRVAVSDILAKKPLSDELRRDVALYVGCVAGASTVAEYEQWLGEAGFKDVMIIDTNADLNVYLEIDENGEKRGLCCGPATDAAAPAGGCCGPVKTEKPIAGGCCGPKPAEPSATSGCCAPPTKQPETASCCAPKTSSPEAPKEASSGCCAPPAQPETASCCAPKPADPPATGGCCSGPAAPQTFAEALKVSSDSLMARTDLNEWVGSFKIFAVKA